MGYNKLAENWWVKEVDYIGEKNSEMWRINNLWLYCGTENILTKGVWLKKNTLNNILVILFVACFVLSGNYQREVFWTQEKE